MQWERSSKCTWSNKFIAPTVGKLREGYPKPLGSVFDAARELILELDGVSESVIWHGVPWRWTLVYKCDARTAADRTRAFAYLIPDPAKLQCCVPLTREQIASLPMRRFKKNLRDSIIHARTVAGLSWPSWDIPSKTAVEDIAELVRRKHRLLRASDESVAMSA
jgi:hypothetical protein